jgi:RecA-family ATPase
MGEGGLRELEREIKKHSDLRLVIIDTFVKFKPVDAGKFVNQYEIDYQHVSEIKKLADENEISVLLIHHLRKTDAPDVFDTFSGTFGITAAADGLLALVKSKDSTELHVTGRDLENDEYALKFESHNLSWEIIGKAEDVQSSKVKQQVYDILKGTDAVFSPKYLAELTGFKRIYIQKAVIKLVEEGKIERVDRGKYKKKRV